MRTLVLLALLPVLLFAGGDAKAHAHLERAEPAADSTVAAPRQVTLWFTQKLEPAFSAIIVTDASGQRVDTGNTRVRDKMMRISVRDLGPGTYRVNWRVLSIDTHRSEGNFTFRVGR